MINKYGADAVRWFILSDSPPEKDVQWSDKGVSSSGKFLQKIWNLCEDQLKRKEKQESSIIKKKFDLEINTLINKLDQSIKEFKFNVAIAQFFETYKVLFYYSDKEISNSSFRNNLINFLKLMIPFTPHIAYECLNKLDCKTQNHWPKIITDIKEDIKFAVQINGTTRDVINTKKNISEP